MNVSIQLELHIDGAAPIGHASVDDGDPRAFSGWVGLVHAVEELLDEHSDPGEERDLSEP
jgi:hypothetical protein